MTPMSNAEHSSIQTRPSLLNRLSAGDDAEGWQEFYRVYGKLVRDFAIKAGLADSEADEVVQETAIAVARHLPEFRYDPEVCRFKTWLLNQTSWRIKDQLRKRQRNERFLETAPPGSPDNDQTATIERVADPGALNLDTLFETEWRKNLFEAALESIKTRFSLKQLQIFDLHAQNGWPAREVAKSLGVTLANVYVTKHRVSAALRKEMERMNRAIQLCEHKKSAQE
jgi:RNA polymerase sigma factor (sigma-70 family)